ncbi:MAG: type II toxin-antitoxin system prevent-host-death family antitoxin [Bifidobacteriaceae bacterium]|jgi:prevent-host-death family protein|nr:type II toxin-antitoxin system prevent-host-death family antitoxin [Bifidobacteriaceae bacterium]
MAYMESVGIRALQRNASAVVARAARGETLTITDHGRPVARLTPVRLPVVEQGIAEGWIVPGTGRFEDLAQPRPADRADITISAVLEHMRTEDR